MGGVKKKSISAVEKTIKKEKRKKSEKDREERAVSLNASEEEILMVISPLKAITVHGVARALGVRASVANSLLRGLEAKGVLTNVGGWSGHHVWKLTS